MLDNFSQSAGRVLFWARSEAGRSEAVEPAHLLLGFIIEDQVESEQAAARHFGDKPADRIGILASDGPPFFSAELAAKLRQAVAESDKPGELKPDHVDMPLAEASKRAIIAAKEHAGASQVRLLHILWALTTDDTSTAILLQSNGVAAEKVESEIRHRY